MGLHCRSLGLISLFVLTTTIFVSLTDATLTYSWSKPTQCDNFTVTWQGGTGPYELLFAPKFKVPLNFSIPDSAYDSNKGQGSFSLTLNISTQSVFLLIMSDSTGFASGGVSPELTVGYSIGGQCNSTDLRPAFIFETPLLLQQCREFEFTNYDGATQPVTIYGLIPAGDAFILKPPKGPTEYNWTADVVAGTSLMFIMTDSKGNQGGASDITGTGLSDDSSCLNSSSPSTTQILTQTQTLSSSSGMPTHTQSSGRSGHSDGAVIGGAVGGGIILLVFLAFLWSLYHRRSESSRRRSGTAGLTDTNGYRKRRGIDLLQDVRDTQAHYPLNPATQAGESSSNDYEPVPYVLPPPAPRSASSIRGLSIDGSDAQYPGHREGTDPGAIGTASYSKASEAMAGTSVSANTPTRFVLHTDAGSFMGSDEGGDEEDEIVELPPQYDSVGHVIPQRQVSRRSRRSQRRPTIEGEGSTSTPPLPPVTDSAPSAES